MGNGGGGGQINSRSVMLFENFFVNSLRLCWQPGGRGLPLKSATCERHDFTSRTFDYMRLLTIFLNWWGRCSRVYTVKQTTISEMRDRSSTHLPSYTRLSRSAPLDT